MQIVLLSGGSGNRLWPLSNGTRSKQFLPLLDSPDGGKESMLQRVVRQIRDSFPEQKITIATNITQKDIIINQIGENVDIVTEPERRDTFPAIALVSCYLSKVKKISSDEIVLVMPCDSYVEDEYFKTILEMSNALSNNAVDLVLMGIKPVYPSSKYGYIIPEQGEKIKRVLRFIEKPDIHNAKKLLESGALWNGGAFAFRLGYLLNIVDGYACGNTFEEVKLNYSKFPKKSFDYEVVEKAQSVSVITYDGAWKDLGTWNTLTDELSQNTIGNVILGAKNENSYVINELGIPIFCDGLKDTIVAGSPDGILVCSKDSSENIKNYVNKLSCRPMYEERRWGMYRVLDTEEYVDGNKSLTKHLRLKAGKNISYQIHHHRDEVWTIVDGNGILVIDGIEKEVKRGDVIHIMRGQLHALKAKADLTLIEVQIGDKLIEEDIERFDWDWKK